MGYSLYLVCQNDSEHYKHQEHPPEAIISASDRNLKLSTAAFRANTILPNQYFTAEPTLFCRTNNVLQNQYYTAEPTLYCMFTPPKGRP